jgi:polyhydroxyalkanoate synthesis regulator phasin
MPYTNSSDDYEYIIRHDEHMTELIDSGQLSRDERTQQIDALIADVEHEEREYREKVLRELELARDELIASQRKLERLRFIERMQIGAFGRGVSP